MDYNGTDFTVNGNYTGEDFLYYDGHPGYDFITTDQGSDVSVLASASGTAYRGSADWGIVYVYHGNGYRTEYWHLVNQSRIADGADVTAGQQIGIAGGTSPTGGAVHLHFEVRKNVNGQWIPVDPYGWNGSGIDPYVLENEVENINLWLDPMPSPEPPPDSHPTQDGCGSQTIEFVILVPIIGYGVRKIRLSRSKV